MQGLIGDALDVLDDIADAVEDAAEAVGFTDNSDDDFEGVEEVKIATVLWQFSQTFRADSDLEAQLTAPHPLL